MTITPRGTMTRLIPALAALPLAACGNSAASSPSWTAAANTGGAAASSAPAFPKDLAGWKAQGTWSGTLRVFTNGYVPVSQGSGDFPVSENGCDLNRFLVRYRVIDQSTTVRPGWAFGSIDASEQSVKPAATLTPAAAGWLAVDGCHTPLFEFAHSSLGDNIADVAIEVRHYVPSP